MNLSYSTVAASFNLAGPDLVVILAIFFVTIPFVIWMVVDCALNETSENNLKLVWLLVILFAPGGSLIYFFVRKISRVPPRKLPPS